MLYFIFSKATWVSGWTALWERMVLAQILISAPSCCDIGGHFCSGSCFRHLQHRDEIGLPLSLC